MYILRHINHLKQYWPKNLNENLDFYVAYLFCQTKSKITLNLINRSQKVLALNLIVLQKKEELLTLVLEEFEVLLLDIIELDLHMTEISMLRTKLLYDLINRSCKQFTSNTIKLKQKFYIEVDTEDLYLLALLKDSKVNFGNLISYILFGSQSHIPVSLQYVEFLLHNLILQISDLIIYLFLCKAITNERILQCIWFCQYPILASNFQSIRALGKLQNRITSQYTKYFYIDQPKAIYNNQYQLSMLTSQGIIDKTIIINRTSEFKYLSHIQLFIPNLIEVQDFLTPQIKSIMLIINRMVIHLCITIFNNILYFVFHLLLKKVIKSKAKFD